MIARAKGLKLRFLEKVFALHDHEHIVFAGGKAAVDLLVAPKLLGVGAKSSESESSTLRRSKPSTPSTENSTMQRQVR